MNIRFSFLVLLQSLLFCTSYAESTCQQFLQSIINPASIDFFVGGDGEDIYIQDGSIYGINITGELQYELDFVLSNLEITPRDLSYWKSASKKVLSVAEGESGLLPFLVSQKVDITGMDLWYSPLVSLPDNEMGRRMQNYRDFYKGYLISGSAFWMPIEDSSVDVLLSHYLVNNLETPEIQKFILEVIRVVANGGEARVFPFGVFEFANLRAFLMHLHPDEINNFSLTESSVLIYQKTGGLK